MNKCLNENLKILTSTISDIYHIVKKLDLLGEIEPIMNDIKEALNNVDKVKEIGLKTQE